MCSKGDYRSAMTHEKEAFTAFTSLVSIFLLARARKCGLVVCVLSYNSFLFQFGEDHPQTHCSKDFLSTITKQAVQVERLLRQAGADCTEQTVEVS